MYRRSPQLIGFVAILFLVAADVHADAFAALAQRTLEHVEDHEPMTLVLVPPSPDRPDLDPGLVAWMEERITAALTARRSPVSVLARRDLDLVAREQDLQQTALYDANRRADFGRAVGADTFGFVDSVDWGDRYVVYLSLVRAGTGEVVSAERAVVRKTLLPSRYVDLSGVMLDALGDPDTLSRALDALIDGPLIDEVAGRRMAVAEVRAYRAGEDLQRAVVRDLHVALFRSRPDETRILLRDTEDLLLTAITEELRSAADPDRLVHLAPQFWGADVLSSLMLDLDARRGQLEVSLRHIDVGRGAYLPGASTAAVPLRSIYEPLYLPPDYLVISSTPEGVPVRVGGQAYGRTPTTVFGLDPGEYTVELSGVPPYAVARRSVSFAQGVGPQTLHVTMERPRIRLRVVDADSGRSVSDVRLQTSSRFVRSGDEYVFSGLETGPGRSLKLDLSAPGYLSGREEFELPPTIEPDLEWVVRLLPAQDLSLSVLTEPEGAMVFIDNRFVGRAPLLDQPIDAPGSSVSVRVQATGWNTVNQDVDVRDIAETGVLSFLLSRDVWLRSTPPGAEVIVNGESVGRTDLQAPLSAGPNTIEFKLGAFERAISFDPSRDEDQEISVTVTRERAEVAVDLVTNVGDVEVWVDNSVASFRGGQLILPEGPHRIRLARSGYAPVVQYVDVRPGAVIYAHMLTVEESRVLQELRGQIEGGRLGQVEASLRELHASNPASPEIGLTLLDLYLEGMERAASRLIPNQRELSRLAREFEDVDRFLRFRPPDARARLQYAHARYADILARSPFASIEYFSQAISGYTAFIEMYRTERGLYLDTDEARSRYEDGHYRRALLAVEQLREYYAGSAAEQDRRLAVERYLTAYLQVPYREKSHERINEVRRLLVEIRE